VSRYPHTLSVVVPCYNEAANIPALISTLAKVLGEVERLQYEIILVDDGSTDDTFNALKSLRDTNPRVSWIRFVRNFGKEAALLAGMKSARGDGVVTMDADLQHPPELLPEMIAKWKEGHDIVQTVRLGRPTVTSSLWGQCFYLLLNWMSDVPLADGTADYRLISRRALDVLLALPENMKFLRGMVAWLGFPSVSITFTAPNRHAGKTTYNVRSLTGLATDAIVTLTSKPLNLALYIAGFTLLIAVLYGAFVLFAFSRGLVLVKGWTSTILLILFLGTANLFCTGVLGLYLRAVLAETRRRPNYVISDCAPASIPIRPWSIPAEQVANSSPVGVALDDQHSSSLVQQKERK